MPPTIRNYKASVDEVFSHVGVDREIINALAVVIDTIGIWRDIDSIDYKKGTEEIPYFHYVKTADGKEEVRGHPYQHIFFQEAFALEVHSHEIRSCSNLQSLGKLYKRLKNVRAFTHGEVFHNIIEKMLWISSGRTTPPRSID